MSDPIPPDVRSRFERFAERLERLPLQELGLLAAQPADPGVHEAAVGTALRAIADHRRGGALADAAVESFVDRQFDEASFDPAWAGPGWGGSSGAAVDGLRLAHSLGDAVTAGIAWDLLDESTRDELLGPWERLTR